MSSDAHAAVQLLVAPHTSEIARGKCDSALRILPSLDFISTPSIINPRLNPSRRDAAEACSSFTIPLGQLSHARQRVLPARELIRKTLGQPSRYFAERRPGAHLAENVLIHRAVRIEFWDVSVAFFAQTVERQGLAEKSGLAEARFDLSP